MAKDFDRTQLLAALDELAEAAIGAGKRLEIAVYGSALVLASNFRFATEDVDIAEIGQPWPEWLSRSVDDIAKRNGWSKDWLNDAVTFHLSAQAQAVRDLVPFGTFPRRSGEVGLTVFVPTARYMLALKLKSLRVSDFAKGTLDMANAANLLRLLHVTDVEQAIAVLAEYFPKSAAHADKERFVVNACCLWSKQPMRPPTLAEAYERIIAGEPREKAIPEFLDTFYLTPTAERRLDTLLDEPPLTADVRLDALAGAIADYLARLYRFPRVPDWAFDVQRFLDAPWHLSPFDDDGMREYLTFASPAEFRSRNIFTEERPLRRARTPVA